MVRKNHCITFEICLIVFLGLINIYTDTKITKIGAFIAKSQAHSVFRAAILNFQFFGGKTQSFDLVPAFFFNSAYPKTPRCKFLCFFPEVHANFTYPPHYKGCLTWTVMTYGTIRVGWTLKAKQI